MDLQFDKDTPKEIREKKHTDMDSLSGKLSDPGIQRMQHPQDSNTPSSQDSLDKKDGLPPLNQEEFITIHPKKSPEHLPNVEKEPKSIKKSEAEFPKSEAEGKKSKEGKIQPPPGWRPGGVEGGG
jgi:hypothetical protein